MALRRCLLALSIVVAVGAMPAAPAAAAVDTIVWSSFTAGPPTDPDSVRWRDILRNTNRYALTTWWSTRYGGQTGQYLDLGGTGEHQVRPAASEAYALAISLRTGAYDPAATGVPTATALARAVKLATSVAHAHRASTGGGWGNAWQSAYWAYLGGTAAWLLWDDLPAADRDKVQRMVEYEADRFIGYRVPYFRDAAGTVLSPGDSKAEENSWNATLLSLAVAMLRGHPHWDVWLYKAAELEVSSFSVPADVTGTRTYHGRRLSEWLYGSNANPDGTVTNHGRIHPDYMATIEQAPGATLLNALTRHSSPRSAWHNADLVYAGLVSTDFTAPPWQAPGGTIYRPGSSSLYYPQGNDWGTDRRAHVATVDAYARLFGFDSSVAPKASVWEPLHAQRVLDMQLRSADRRTYTAAGEDTYAGREEWVARQAASAWLGKWIARQGTFRASDNTYRIVVDNADREFAIVSGSWTTNTSGPQILGSERYTAAGSGSAVARFAPRLSTSRSYRVYAWWNPHASHASDTPYLIRRADGTTATVRVNQRTGGGWTLLGTYPLAPGVSTVDVRNDANGYVVADAVMVEPA